MVNKNGKKKIVLASSIFIVALFIGTSIGSATAESNLDFASSQDIESIKDSSVESSSASSDIADQSSSSDSEECAACAAAAAAQSASTNVESATLSGTSNGDPCETCVEAVNIAFESVGSYILNNLPEFNIDDWTPMYVLEYVLDVRDIVVFGIGIGLLELGVKFAPYADDVANIAISTFVSTLLDTGHLLTAVGNTIYEVVDFLIEVCKDLNGCISQPNSTSMSASSMSSSAASSASSASSSFTSASSGSMGISEASFR